MRQQGCCRQREQRDECAVRDHKGAWCCHGSGDVSRSQWCLNLSCGASQGEIGLVPQAAGAEVGWEQEACGWH